MPPLTRVPALTRPVPGNPARCRAVVSRGSTRVPPRGRTVPTGETEFQFHAASFQFNSAVYEWLVVSGALAQYKGSGTINGAGDYAFMLTAIDGQLPGGGGVDKLRIKIWNKATGAVVTTP